MAMGLMLVGPATPAQAAHNNGTRICERGDGGRNYNHLTVEWIYNHDDVRIGRVSINWRGQLNHRTYCIVTIRRFHDVARWTMAKIKREPNRRWHTDAGYYHAYAGPVYACACRGDAVVGWGSIAGHEAKYFRLR